MQYPLQKVNAMHVISLTQTASKNVAHVYWGNDLESPRYISTDGPSSRGTKILGSTSSFINGVQVTWYFENVGPSRTWEANIYIMNFRFNHTCLFCRCCSAHDKCLAAVNRNNCRMNIFNISYYILPYRWYMEEGQLTCCTCLFDRWFLETGITTAEGSWSQWWSLGACGLWGHVVFRDMWSLGTCGNWGHVVFVDMWSLETCCLWGHVVFGDIWCLGTCGLWGHVVSGDMWSLGKCGIWWHVVFGDMWSLGACYNSRYCVVFLSIGWFACTLSNPE